MWRSFICALRPAPRAPARHPREFRDHTEEVRTPVAGHTHSITGQRSVQSPSSLAGLVAGGPIAEHGRPIPIRGYWRDPAMPRNATTPLEGRYTGNDSWSANELDIDWQGVTSTIFTSAGAP